MKKIIAIICLICINMLYINQPAFAELDQSSFTIVRSNVPLNSTLDAKYNGFQYTMKNNTKEKLLIQNFIVDDGTKPKDAYADVKRNGWGAAGVAFVYGWNYVLPTLGMSLVAAVIASPLFVGASMFGNLGAKMEANRFISGSLINGYFKSKEKKTFKVFAPEGTIPTLKILLEDPAGEKYMYSNTHFGSSFEKVQTPTEEELEAKDQDQAKDKDKDKDKTSKADSKDQKDKEKADAEDEKSSDDSEDKKDSKSSNFKEKLKSKMDEVKSEFQLDDVSDKVQSESTYHKYNTGVTTDPTVKTKQQFEENKNFVSF